MVARALTVDAAAETERIARFIESVVKSAGAKGVVLGLSGGVDSAVVGALCVRALGRARVLALLMPSASTPKDDMQDATALAKGWGVRAVKVDISGVVSALVAAAKMAGTKIARANLQARARMTLLYYFANTLAYLVAGTGDRSEESIGFFTKYGDGGVDFLPVAHLYKTQVRALGVKLGVPRRIVEKPASPQLWRGHRASDEIPVNYEKLDIILSCVFDEKMTPGRAASAAGVSQDVVGRVLKLGKKTEHKRTLPPSLV